jgi:hypothetical protein
MAEAVFLAKSVPLDGVRLEARLKVSPAVRVTSL